MTPSSRRSALQLHASGRAGARARRGADGFGLVEVLVALLLLALVVVPITDIVLTTHDSANTLHRRAEAVDLATQALETVQYQAAQGVPLTTGITTTSSSSGGDTFNVALNLQVLPQSGVGTLCSASPGATSTEIWQATATASWGGAIAPGDAVVERTLIAPAQADLAGATAGELAIPVYTTVAASMSTTTTTTSPGSPAALPTTLETATPISITVTGTCTLPGGCVAPSGSPKPVTSETENTGSTGCAVFPNLWAATGWVYSATVEGNPGWVDESEASDAPTASGLPTLTDISLTGDSVTVPKTTQLTLDQGAPVVVHFVDSIDPGAAPAPFLPVTVASPGACGSAGLCVLGNGTSAFATSAAAAQTALLFPFPSAGANYTVYAGGATDSNPTQSYYGTVAPTVLDAAAGTSATVTVPVYPLVLAVTVNSDAGTVSQLVARDAGGTDNVTLNYAGGATSATGLPLGEFLLGANVTGSNAAVTSGGKPVYVWVTPAGVCASPAPLTAPCASPTPYTTPIAVTVG